MSKLFLISSILAMSQAVLATDDWRQHDLIYVTENTADVVYGPIQNTGTTGVTVTGQSGSDGPKHRWILGAATAAPPTWDSRFNPLQTNTVSQAWSFDTLTLPANKAFEVDVLWINSYGHQSFDLFDSNGVDTGTQIRRDRDWWDPNGVVYLQTTITSSGGGGSSGGGS